MRLVVFLLLAFAAAAPAAVKPEVAELSFDGRFNQPGALAKAKAPGWITRVEQRGGGFLNDPHCWAVAAGGADGTGRLEITLDRKKIGGSLIASILFDADQGADVAVQLFDHEGRVVVVDLFGNLVEVGQAALTNTFIIPLQKYPAAEKIVLRRISGGLKVYGMLLMPAVAEGQPVPEALQELARTLGDPLSPENPLVKGLREIARNSDVALKSGGTTGMKAAPALPSATPAPEVIYSPAAALVAGATVPLAPSLGLVGHWSFENEGAADSSGGNRHGHPQKAAKFVPAARGTALQLTANPVLFKGPEWDAVLVPHSPALDLKDSMTVSAWVNYQTIARNWGSQIVWYGDEQLGRDPWELHLLRGGWLEFRSDRSVSGQPVFTVFENEIALSPAGRPQMNQHVAVRSPGRLKAGEWYYVAATMEQTSPRERTMRLYVNGELAGITKTPETINYDTSNMWMTIGGVDKGNWQNFDGQIGDVRVYDRPLTPAEIKVLYQQPWK